ncbi:serine hydrolase [Natrialba sp. PRR66]|uniref:serine hydrolase n=1 Tax=Natrialba sp. PRR66 TaxID=3098146 RepID=UPI002B1E3A3D|nr:serine hydrolase [Natrialba sp. PRR66]
MSEYLTRRRFLAGSATAGATIGLGVAPDQTQATNTGSTAEGRDSLEAFVDETVEAELAKHDATGAVVSIVRDGSVVLSRGYGETPFDETAVKAEKTPIQAGSISKLITFTAAMQLVDRGVIDPDDDVNPYLESVSVQETYDKPITLSHLATHTAGYENRIRNEMVGDLDHRQSLEDAIDSYQPERIHQPGELMGYTNYVATLTGQLVADVTGSPFHEYAATDVFDPLRMERSTFEAIPNHLDSNTRDHLLDYLLWHSNGPPSSGLWTTGTDMAQFMLAHLNGGATDAGRILSEEATSDMHRRWFTPHEKFDGMTFGFFERHRDGVRFLTHDGDGPGYRSSLILIPELDLGLFVSFLGHEPGTSVWSVQDAFLDHYVPATNTELTPSGRPERADDLEGTYRDLHAAKNATYEKALLASFYAPDTEVWIEEDGTLVTDGSTTKRWVEIEPLVFRRADGKQTLVFHENNGTVAGFSISTVPYGEYSARAVGSVPRTLVPVSLYDNMAMQTNLALASSLVVLSGVLGWPLAVIVRRYRDSSSLEAKQARRARWSAGGAGALLFGFVAAVLVVSVITSILGGPELFNRPPRGFRALFAMPLAATVATLAAAGYIVPVWRERLWSFLARVHYTVVVGSLAVLLWLFHYWNLLGVPTT